MIALGRATMVGALAVWFAVVGNAPAEPPPEIARADWHFRESLGAIADWETILARLEGTVPANRNVYFEVLDADMVNWADARLLRTHD